jgi:hypothetical protein
MANSGDATTNASGRLGVVPFLNSTGAVGMTIHRLAHPDRAVVNVVRR